MSDNSTGSSGSSTNSWTLLSPEEAAIDTVGPVDDGTESIDDAPSLSEEVAGSSLEVRPSESEAPQETILSEEGHQICQETTPEFFEEGAASGMLTIEDDPEICAPVIHDTITSSPPDNDLLSAVPFSLATEAGLFLSGEASLEKPYAEAFTDELSPKERSVQYTSTAEVSSRPECIAEISLFTEPTSEISTSAESESEVSLPLEPTAEVRLPPEKEAEICLTSKLLADVSVTPAHFAVKSPSPLPPEPPFSDVTADIRFVSIGHTSAIPVADIQAEVNCSPENPTTDIHFTPVTTIPYPETTASPLLEELVPTTVREEHEIPDKCEAVVREEESLCPDAAVEHPEEGVGLRLRHVQQRQSSDEEDQEEEEFKLQERREAKSSFSLNHLIIGSLVLLCLGSLFFSGTMLNQDVDDYDGSELSDQELLEKLAQENKQISILEAQIQTQKEELDKALQMAADKGITDKENARMKEELSALPDLKSELEVLKARVAELTQLAAEDPSESSPSTIQSSPGTPKDNQGPAKSERHLNKKDELKRQKTLLDQSKERLEGMKNQGWHKKGLRESLVEMQQRLSNQVDHLGQRDEWKRKNKEHKGGKKGKNDRDEKWNSKEMEKGNERKSDKDKYSHGQKHKEYLNKYSDEWEHKKKERRQEREKRKQQRSGEMKNIHQHSHDQHHESKDFWKHQDKKLRRNRLPAENCHNVVNCAEAEGLIPVKLPEFQGLLQSYLSKLEELTDENKEAFHRLVIQFFRDDIFSHDRMLFSKFAEDVADILEDLADALKDDDILEEKMEEFEREVLWKFTA